jgi:hypothetical protein
VKRRPTIKVGGEEGDISEDNTESHRCDFKPTDIVPKDIIHQSSTEWTVVAIHLPIS